MISALNDRDAVAEVQEETGVMSESIQKVKRLNTAAPNDGVFIVHPDIDAGNDGKLLDAADIEIELAEKPEFGLSVEDMALYTRLLRIGDDLLPLVHLKLIKDF